MPKWKGQASLAGVFSVQPQHNYLENPTCVVAVRSKPFMLAFSAVSYGKIMVMGFSLHNAGRPRLSEIFLIIERHEATIKQRNKKNEHCVSYSVSTSYSQRRSSS